MAASSQLAAVPPSSMDSVASTSLLPATSDLPPLLRTSSDESSVASEEGTVDTHFDEPSSLGTASPWSREQVNHLSHKLKELAQPPTPAAENPMQPLIAAVALVTMNEELASEADYFGLQARPSLPTSPLVDQSDAVPMTRTATAKFIAHAMTPFGTVLASASSSAAPLPSSSSSSALASASSSSSSLPCQDDKADVKQQKAHYQSWRSLLPEKDTWYISQEQLSTLQPDEVVPPSNEGGGGRRRRRLVECKST